MILNLLTFGLYKRVEQMSASLIDAVAKQTLRNKEIDHRLDNKEEPDVEDAVDTYMHNSFCASDYNLLDDDEVEYKIEQMIDELRVELEDKINELDTDKE